MSRKFVSECNNIISLEFKFESLFTMHDIELLKKIEKAPSLFCPENSSKSLLNLSETPRICVLNLFPFLDSVTPELLDSIKTKSLNHILLNVKGIYTNEILVIFNTFGAAFSGFIMELCIRTGCQNFIIFGSAGILASNVQTGEIIIPDRMIRDEGTSFHYLAPARSLAVNQNALNRLTTYLKENHIQYHQDLHWTTDAPFRETSKKVARLRNEGCISVDMESSALCAIAEYYQKSCVAFLIGQDRLGLTDEFPSQHRPFRKTVTDHYKTLIRYIHHDWNL